MFGRDFKFAAKLTFTPATVDPVLTYCLAVDFIALTGREIMSRIDSQQFQTLGFRILTNIAATLG